MEFSRPNERAIVELLSHLPERRACIMALLDIAQRQFGSLSPDVLTKFRHEFEEAIDAGGLPGQ